MYCIRKVNDDYTWVGADCRRLALFEGVFGVPDGVSFNSYLLMDDKTVLFDTVDSAVRTTFRENVAHVLNGKAPDYLVVHHMEPDHAAEMADLARQYPDMGILCSAAAKNMIAQFFDAELAGRVTVVKEGDTLCTGRHTLRFIAAPMVHWPEVLMTYDETDKLLLSADAFGSFGALNGTLFADEVDFDREVLDEARRYYTNIVGKYGAQVQAVLQKAAGLDIRMLLPLHGPVWRQDLGYILGKYDLWSRWEPEVRGVMIAYASVYGNTENAANILACRLVEQGVKVKMYDVSVTPSSHVVSDAFKYSHLVFAATTYNMGIFVTMEQLLLDIAAHQLADRRYALIENGSDKVSAILDIVREDIHTCAPVHFEGNGYSEEWVEEAKRRGLDCETSCPKVFERYLDEDSIRMFESQNVMTRKELEARNEVKWETYTKKIQIEARVFGDLSMNHIIPVCTHYQSRLAKNVQSMYDIFPKETADNLTSRNKKIIEEIAERTQIIETGVEDLVNARKVANKIESEHLKAIAYHDTVAPKMEEIRYQIDKLELVVADELWTLPKYRELLFIR